MLGMYLFVDVLKKWSVPYVELTICRLNKVSTILAKDTAAFRDPTVRWLEALSKRKNRMWGRGVLSNLPKELGHWRFKFSDLGASSDLAAASALDHLVRGPSDLVSVRQCHSNGLEMEQILSCAELHIPAL